MSTVCELDYRGLPPEIHCPVCGSEITGTLDIPCEHLLFSYVYEVGEFSQVPERINNEYGDKIDELEHSEMEDPPEKLVNTIDKDSVLCLTVTTTGISCGPVSSTYS